jgi:adenine/guanine phosphoribosyltransferase-like PRPP-binding protein
MGTGSYFDKALTNTNGELIETMRYRMHGVRYDTIIGTGLSGTIFAARVAPGLGKNFAIVRKDKDGSHSGAKVEGIVGSRYVIADDFVSTGATLKRVMERMREWHPNAEFVGVYQYERETFTNTRNAPEIFGNWITDVMLGGPILGPKTLRQAEEDALFGRVVLTCPEGGWDTRVAEMLPLPPLSRLELDYMRDGEPTFWEKDRRYRIYAQDRRVQDLVRIVRPMILDGSYGRNIGMTMDAVRQNRAAWLKPLAVESLQKFSTAIDQAGTAIEDINWANMRG